MSVYTAFEDGEHDGVIQDGLDEGCQLYVDSAIGWIEYGGVFTGTVNGNRYAVTSCIGEES